MAAEPFELVEIEIGVRPGGEREAIRDSANLASMHRRGWRVAGSWIATRREKENGLQVGPDRQFLMLLLQPPLEEIAAVAVMAPRWWERPWVWAAASAVAVVVAVAAILWQ